MRRHDYRRKDGSQILLAYNQGLDPSEVLRLDVNIILPGFYIGKFDGICTSTIGSIDSSKVTVQNFPLPRQMRQHYITSWTGYCKQMCNL